jgi:hypothetical protein
MERLIEDFERDLKTGESQEIEFVADFTESARDVAKEIAAFATSNSGRIYLGVNDYGELVGVSGVKNLEDIAGKDECQKRAQGISRIVKPAIRVKVAFLKRRDKIIVRISVPKGSEPVYYCHGVPYLRDLTSSRPATPSEVKELQAARKEIQPSEEESLVAYEEKAMTFGIILLYVLCYLPIRLWSYWAQGKGLDPTNWLVAEALVYPFILIVIIFVLTYVFGTNLMKATIRLLRKLSVPYLVSFGVVVLVILVLNLMILLYPESTRFFFLNAWRDFLVICVLSLAIASITIFLSYFPLLQYFAKLQNPEYVTNPAKDMRRLVQEWMQKIGLLQKKFPATILLGLLIVTIAIVPIDITTGLFIPTYHEKGESFSHSYYGISDILYLFIYSERISPDTIRSQYRFYRLVQCEYIIDPARLALLSTIRIPNPTNNTRGSAEDPKINAISSDVSTTTLGSVHVSVNTSKNIDYRFIPLEHNFTHIEFEFSKASEPLIANISYWKLLENVNVSMTTIPTYTDLGNGTWIETYTYLIENNEEVSLRTMALDFDRFMYTVVNKTTTKVYSQGQEQPPAFFVSNTKLGIWLTIGSGYTLNLTITFHSSNIT